MNGGRSSNRRRGIGFALGAAFLFGAGTPVAKVLLPGVNPMLMAGLLYLGSGIGLGIYRVIRSSKATSSYEAALTRKDWPWLAGSIVAGGIVAPVLLMWGLASTPASTTSLLLNLEGALSVSLAWFVFREHFNRRVALGMALILAGGVSLSWDWRTTAGPRWGSLAIAGACLGWAMDNNLTRKISAGDPVQIAIIKGLAAGGVNTILAFSLGAKLPPASLLLESGVLGFFSYGVSLTFFVLALRHIGTARTSAYFSTAPFVGAAISIAWLGDPFTLNFGAAAVLMGLGVWLHLTERPDLDHRHSH